MHNKAFESRKALFFFFSSRRRHTRCLSDWSSDVCSSDLTGQSANATFRGAVKMLNRRDAMMRLGQAGLGLLTLPRLLQGESAPAGEGKARSCIYLFLWGGPPQQDLWDPKPEAPTGVRSPFGTIRTAVPGITICDQMPRLARLLDKVAVVRSVTHKSDVHEPSVYHMLTGEVDPTLVVPRNQRRRS